jgi:D-alanyl-lipoteichoic acid acyltransferase DltB (MBOAT superfamily)
MVSSTLTYFLFFAVVAVLYWRLPTLFLRNLLLFGGSLFFYAWWDWRFCGLLVGSALVDYVCAGAIAKSNSTRRRRLLLLLSVGANLGVLGFFKYFGFFVESACAALEAMGLSANRPALSIVLPVGISFYTFQTLSYTIDVSRGRMRAARDPLAYLCYVCFFPQLVAGPIERAPALLPQFLTPRAFSSAEMRAGLRLMLWGLFKKIAVGDSLAPVVEGAYGDPGAASSAMLAIATLAFGIQIYADFSGYTDLARGSAKILGFELMRNFDHPFLALSPSDFWRRWHISLSSWFRDYVYIPLGGNRRGKGRRLVAVWTTFLLSGLWHGASWNFVLWGALHGSVVAGQQALAGRVRPLPRPIAWLATFAFVMLTWVFFRAGSLAEAKQVFAGLSEFGGAGGSPSPLDWLRSVPGSGSAFAALAVMLASERRSLHADTPLALLRIRWLRWSFAALLFWWIVDACAGGGAAPFIYFDF